MKDGKIYKNTLDESHAQLDSRQVDGAVSFARLDAKTQNALRAYLEESVREIPSLKQQENFCKAITIETHVGWNTIE